MFRGNIKHPMDLRALGRVMSAMGYVSKRLGKTRVRGFLVIENQVNSSTALALAQKIRAQEMADKADKGQEVFTYPPTHAYYIIYNMMALGTNGSNYKNLILWQK